MDICGNRVGLVAFSLFFPVLYTKGPNWVSYYTKFVLYYGSLTLIASLCLPLTIFRPRDPRNLLLVSAFMRRVATLLGLKYTLINPIEASKRLSSASRSSIVVINHQSSLDILLLLCELWPLMNGMCTIISKRSLLYTGPFGFMAFMSGVTFINRSAPEEARMIVNQTAQKCKENNWKLVVFPEGTRHHNPEKLDMLPFRLGAFNAALSAKIPIQPVVYSHYDFYDRKRKIFQPGGVRIHVLEPVETDSIEDPKGLSENTREKMLETFVEDSRLHPSIGSK